MAKQLNVALNVDANTNQAKQALIDLKKTLIDIQASRTITINDTSLQEAKQAAADLKLHLDRATSVDTGKLNLGTFSQSLKKSGQDLNTLYNKLSSIGPQGQKAFLSLTQSIVQADHASLTLGNRLSALGTTLANTVRWQLSSSMIHAALGALQSAYGYAQDLNKSLNNIRIVTGKSIDEMAAFAEQANKAAQALNTSTTGYTDAALIYYQQGIRDQKEIAERVATTVKLANVSRQSAEDVSSQMTAIWNNFDDGTKSLEYYADVITALGAATASSSDEIAQGLQKFASVADTVGLSYEKATAALATVVAETRQSADVIGTAFKTMFARFQGLSLGETLEDGVDLNKYSKALATVGVKILDANDNLKNMDVILDETYQKWNSITEAQRVALAETVAGTRQYAQFMALMNNYDKILSNQALAANSEGTLQEQADIYAESWEAAGKRVKTALESITQQLLRDDLFIGALNGIEKIITTISGAIRGLGGLKTILLAIGTIITQKYAADMPQILSKLVGNFNVLTGAAEKQRVAMIQDTNEIIQNMNATESGSKGFQAQVVAMQYASQMTTELEQKKKSLSRAEIQAYQSKIKEVELYGQIVTAIGEEIDALEKEKQSKSQQVTGELFTNHTLSTKVYSDEETAEIEKEKNAIAELEAELKRLEDARIGFEPQPAKVQKINQEINATNSELSQARNRLDALQKAGGKTGSQLSKEFQQAAQQAGRMENVLSKTIERTHAWSAALKKADPNNLKKIKDEMLAYADVMDSAGLRTAEFRKLLENPTQDGLQQALDYLIDTDSDLFQSFFEVQEKVENLKSSLMGLGVSESILNGLEATMRKLGMSSEEIAAAFEELKKKFTELPQHAVSLSESLARVGSIAMSLSMAFNAIKNIGNIFNDDSLTDGEKLVQVLTAIGMLLPAINSLLSAQNLQWASNTVATLFNTIAKKANAHTTASQAVAEGTETGAKKASTIATWAQTAANWALNASLGPLLLVILAITAALVALTLIINTIVKAIKAAQDKKPEKQLEKAAENTKKLKEELENAKTANDNLKSSFQNYREIYDKLAECTKGTTEWKEAMEQAKDAAQDLIDKYPVLLSLANAFDSNGLITPEALDYIEGIDNTRVALLNRAVLGSQINTSKKQEAVAEKDLDTVMWEHNLARYISSAQLEAWKTNPPATSADIAKLIDKNANMYTALGPGTEASYYRNSAFSDTNFRYKYGQTYGEEAIKDLDYINDFFKDYHEDDEIVSAFENDDRFNKAYDFLLDYSAKNISSRNTEDVDYDWMYTYANMYTQVEEGQYSQWVLQSSQELSSALDQLSSSVDATATLIYQAGQLIANNVLPEEDNYSDTSRYVGGKAYDTAYESELNNLETAYNGGNGDSKKLEDAGFKLLLNDYLTSLGYKPGQVAATKLEYDKDTDQYNVTLSDGQSISTEYMRQMIAADRASNTVQTTGIQAQQQYNNLSSRGQLLSDTLAQSVDANGEINLANLLRDFTEKELEDLINGITDNPEGGTFSTDRVNELLGGVSYADVNTIGTLLDLGGGGGLMKSIDQLAEQMYKNMPDLGLHAFDESKMTYGEQQDYLTARDKALTAASDQGIDAYALSRVASSATASGEDLTSFFNEISNIDFSDIKAGEHVQELIDQFGVANDQTSYWLNDFIKQIDEFPKHIDTSTVAIEKEAEAIGKIIKDGLKLGDAVKAEDYKVLKDAGIEVDKYFTKMADGTYQLTAAADDFNKAARKITQDKLVDKANQFDQYGQQLADKYNQSARGKSFAQSNLGSSNASSENKSARLEYIQGFADLFDTAEHPEFLTILSTDLENVNQLTNEDIEVMNEMLDIIKQEQLNSQAMALSSAANFTEFNRMITEMGLENTINPEQLDMINNASQSLALSMMDAATSIYELDAALSEIGTAGANIASEDKINALIRLAEQYDNCAQEIEAMNYALANAKTNADGSLTQASQEIVNAAEDNLRAATLLGEASKEYGFDARALEIQAQAIRSLHSELKLTAEDAARMAIANQRMNKGIATLNKSFAEWKKTLTTTQRTSADFANALSKVENAIADLLGAEEHFELPDALTDEKTLAHTLDLVEKAAKGDQLAINQLGAEVVYAQADMMFFNEAMRDAFEGEYDTSRFDGAKQNVLDGITAIQNNLQALTDGTMTIDEAMGGSSENWVQSLNEMAIATGMTVDEMNGMLNKLGVQAHVEVKSVKQEMEVPTQEEIYLPSGSDTFTYSEVGEDGKVTEHTIKRPRIRKAVVPGKPIKTTGYVQVPQISTDGDPKTVDVSYTGVGGGSSGGGISPSSTAGSGGGGGNKDNRSSAKEHKQPTEEKERYHVLNEQLDDLSRAYDKASKAKDRLFGANKLKAINSEIKALDNLIKHNQSYLKTIGTYREQDKAKLLNGGLTKDWVDSAGNLQTFTSSGLGLDLQFDAEGTLLNYDQYVETAVNAYNAAVDAYNQVVRAEGVTEEQVKAAGDVFKQAEMQYELAMQVLSTYEETNNKYQEKLEEIRDSLREQQDKRLEEFQYKLELKIKISDNNLKQLEYLRKSLADDKWASVEYLETIWNTAGNQSDWTERLTRGADLHGAWDELKGKTHGDVVIDANGNVISQPELSQEGYIEETQELIDQLYEEIDALWELDDTMCHYYEETLQKGEEELDKYMSRMEDVSSVLEHYKNISELLGKEKNYEWMGTILEGQSSAKLNEMDSARRQFEAAETQYEHMQEKFEELKAAGVDDATLQKAQAELDAQYDVMVKWQESYLSKTEEYAELQKAVYENMVASISQTMEDAFTGGMGFDRMLDSMEMVSSTQDMILTKTNQIYETNKLMRKLSQDIDKTDSAAAKSKLASFKQEIADMQEKNEMSKFDLEVANARYDLLLAQIALEEAQNAKSTVRLQRDNEGNYGYIYTADEDKVADAEQNVEDKQNGLYNLSLEKANENAQALIQLDQELNDKLNEISLDYTLSEEERQQKMAAVKEEYAQKRARIEKDYLEANFWLNETATDSIYEAWANNYTDIGERLGEYYRDKTGKEGEIKLISAGVAQSFSDEWKTSLGTVTTDTLTWRITVGTYISEVSAAFEAYKTEMDTKVSPVVGQNLDDLTEKVGLLNTASDTYKTQFDDFVDTNAERLQSISDLTHEYYLQRQELLMLIKTHQDLIKEMNQQIEEATNSTDDTTPTAPPTDEGNEGNEPTPTSSPTDTSGTGSLVEFLADVYYGRSGNGAARKQYFKNLGYSDEQIAEYQGVINSFYSQNGWDESKAWKALKSAYGFDTGGYTGEWGDSSKLAFLHEKELVLNADDTTNLLKTVDLVRALVEAIDLQAISSSMASNMSSPTSGANMQTLQQEVTIHAEFPNATDRNEIEEAFTSLINQATQYAHAKRY